MLELMQSPYPFYPPTERAITHLNPGAWEYANRLLVAKAISEFSHELLLKPRSQNQGHDGGDYLLASKAGTVYRFQANIMELDHWHIDIATLSKLKGEEELPLDTLEFILEFREDLGIPEAMMPVYMEEITSTLFSLAYKYQYQRYDAAGLLEQGFQEIEHAMTAGHPCFVANSGRLGFNGPEYHRYSPEVDHRLRLVWIAGHRRQAVFSSIKGLDYGFLMRQELGEVLMGKFEVLLSEIGLNATDYIFLPVHPWQWQNKISILFAQDIAQRNIVFLGEGLDEHSPQQSIRTLYNASHPKKHYVKTSLSILNMGFTRGLSPHYMQSTPAITEWISGLLEEDAYLRELGFEMLGEVATVGYRNRYYEALGKTQANNKMLAALWRESPWTKIQTGQQPMTMAALLHTDREGQALLPLLIEASGMGTEEWLRQYLSSYFLPLVHCLYAYELVFIPHGENLILVMEGHVPVRAIMKDITEEVIVFDENMDLPEKAKRLLTVTTDDKKVLSLFTDVFDGFFRFMACVLEQQGGYPASRFWGQVAACVHTYQEEHPEYRDRYGRFDLFTASFERVCLNRLQLNNTKQMLDLADPIDSLEIAGTLKNPLLPYRNPNKKELSGKEPLNVIS